MNDVNIELCEDQTVLATSKTLALPSQGGSAGEIYNAAVATAAAPPGGIGMVRLVLPDGQIRSVAGLGFGASSPSRDVWRAGLLLGREAINWGSLAIDLTRLTNIAPVTIRDLVEGFILGDFRLGASSGPPDASTARIVLPTGESTRSDLRLALRQGLVSAHHANWTRELVERPAAELPPGKLAGALEARAKALGVEVEVWDRERMDTEGFGGTLAVGAGSHSPPAVVILRSGAGRSVGLAGKGVTFDSGGLNLKRDLAEIAYMKSDMAGAAAVAGAIFAAVELGHAPDVLAVLPMAENMPGGGALRPGDRITHPDGTKTEVIDTDCEGRLLLADSLAWLRKRGVEAIIDVATLSDGGGVGPLFWGAWANAEELVDAVTMAGATVHDPGWHLPLRELGHGLLASRVADLTNASSDEPDTGQLAATYLSRFAGPCPWVHIDNGSSAYLLDEAGPWPEGATGSPMRALLQFLIERAGHAL